MEQSLELRIKLVVVLAGLLLLQQLLKALILSLLSNYFPSLNSSGSRVSRIRVLTAIFLNLSLAATDAMEETTTLATLGLCRMMLTSSLKVTGNTKVRMAHATMRVETSPTSTSRDTTMLRETILLL